MENLIDQYLSDDQNGAPQTDLKVGPLDKLVEVGSEAFPEPPPLPLLQWIKAQQVHLRKG